MLSDPVVAAVLACFADDLRISGVEPLGSGGGFSGARLWRVQTDEGLLCLRRWPAEHPTPDRLAYIHGVLRQVRKRGCRLLPLPRHCRAGQQSESFVRHDAALWDVTDWLDGQADFHALPSAKKLAAAMTALAEVHLKSRESRVQSREPDSALRTPSGSSLSALRSPLHSSRVAGALRAAEAPECLASPAIATRRALAAQWQSGWLAELPLAIQRFNWPQLGERAGRILALTPKCLPHVIGALEHAAQLRVPLQPCLCDIWHDHVLYTGDRVTGIVDYGALRVESVAADISRLLGSMAADDTARWQHGLAAYETQRPYSADERRLITVLDASSVLLSPLNWLRWIYLEGRQFENRAGVLERLDHFMPRLERLANIK